MAADDLRMKLDYGPSWVGRYYVTDSELSTIRFTPNVAWRINENFSIGGGLDYLGADFLHVAAVNNPEPTLKDGRLKFDDRDMGLGGNLGLLWEIDQDTRLGLTYKSQVLCLSIHRCRRCPDASTAATLPGLVRGANQLLPISLDSIC